MTDKTTSLAESTEPGNLGVLHLKRYWEKNRQKKTGILEQDAYPEEWNMDITLLAVLGLGLEQTIVYLFNSSPAFSAFEDWILAQNEGRLNQAKVNEFNSYVLNSKPVIEKNNTPANVLSEKDIDFWNEQGYVIIRNAIPAEDCDNTIKALCEFINIKRDDPSTWYDHNPARQGIMVQLFQHPALEKNRLSKKIRSAYEQLWQRKDLWVNTDRVGFNPPENEKWKFPGPLLHWDVSLALPIPFGLQGILYLSDTAADQGAFTLVPGFHHRVEGWLSSLTPGTDPRKEDIYALGARPIVANAGDFIIWHQALPHGSSPNRSVLPRFVQYINFAPLDAEVNPEWI